MDTLSLELLGIVLLIGLVAFFSASEVAVLSSRKSRMKELAENGNRNATTILGFLEKPETFLATVHVGNIFSLNLASGLGGILGLQHLSPYLHASETTWISEGAEWISLTIMVVRIGTGVVVFGELVPKSVALRFAERVNPCHHCHGSSSGQCS